ncbi:hypothetical protein C2U72_07395 [Prosthecomicrobium hirschii]|uniref:putative bifunctional diguanylate cyclase/phosphodiesterase n=1 Tax=Prosthecodimorpha hirschii TaxID=665126 RepID=UPI00112D7955|nr:EAL domain-containing protein [Prosthecomicrobium hirschii]TPQ51611.1 hypothetical protein C2U72_07395 [Prosthecomicrobium hirschii]
MALKAIRSGWEQAMREASIMQSIAALVCFALLFLTMTAAWTSQQANDLAVDRQVRLATNGLEQEIERIGTEVQTGAVSDDAYRRIHIRFDADFAERAFGARLWRDYRHDMTLLIGPGRAILQAHVAGRMTEPKDLKSVLVDVSGPLERVRNQIAEIVRRPLGQDDPELMVGKIVRETAVLRVGDRAALVAVSALVPEDGKGLKKSVPPTVVVAVKFVAGDLLARMARQFVLPELQFVPIENHEAVAAVGRASATVKTSGDQTLGFLVWAPSQPGYQMMRHLAPLIVIATALFVIFALIVVVKFQRRTAELAKSEERAKRSAMHDALSGLANRVLFAERLEAALVEVEVDPKRSCAIVYVDLDRFKDVNDTLGHQAGDEVIRVTAKRLDSLMRPGDTAARISGDEFAMVVRSAPDRAELEQRLGAIVREIARPIAIGDRTVYPGGSVGCALAPEHGKERADLQHKADLALYRAKAGGRGRWLIFSPEMDDGFRRVQQMRQDLRASINEGRLTVLYQPYFSVAEMRAIGVEARVAWDHPTRGRLSAGEFIPVAEQCGLIREIGAFILHRAARDMHRWPGVRLAVNVSPLEIRQADFAESLMRILEDEGLDPARLQVDITENILLTDADAAITAIATLRKAGIRVALDEFGSGQSSFNYLSRFRFDTIKIDRSFVAKLETSPEVATIVHSMVELANKLGLETVAEGVETFGQFRFIQAAGCQTVQGHLCARPMPATEVSRFLEHPLSERIRAVA